MTWILAMLIVLRLGLVTALWFGLPPVWHEGWVFQAGDEEDFFRLASALAHGAPERSIFTIGYPLLLVPWIWLTRATSYHQIAAPVVWLQAYGLIPLCLLGVAWLGQRLSGRRSVGLLAAGLWAMLPALIGGLLWWVRSVAPLIERHYDPAQQMASQLGVHVMSDTVSLALVLAAFWRLMRAAEIGLGRSYGVAGLLAGAAVLVRLSNMAVVAVGVLSLCWQRRWAGLAVFLGCLAVVMIPQLWYNGLMDGSPFCFAWVPEEQMYLSGAREAGLVSYPYPAVFAWANVGYLGQWLLERMPPVALAGFGMALLTGLAALVVLARRGRRIEAGWLGLWVLGYAAVFLPYYGLTSWIIRYLTPVYPAGCIAVAIVVDAMVRRLRRG